MLFYSSAFIILGGGITFMQGLAKALKEKGYDIKILFSHNSKTESDTLSLIVNAVNTVDVLCWFGSSSINHTLKMLRLLRNLGARKPVLRFPLGTILIRKPNRPAHIYTNVTSILERVIESKFYPQLHHCIENRDDYKLLKALGFSVFYTPPGVDTEMFKPTMDKNNTFTVLCNAAPATWVKGTDYLLRIMSNILNSVEENILLIVITGGMGQKFFRWRLKNLEKTFSKRCMVIDRWLSREEISNLLAKSHLLVFPSRFEGSGNLILEAQSCGVPVVAFNIPGAPRDVVINNVTGYLIKPYDVNEFSTKIIEVYKMAKTKRYEEMCKRARENALRFDWRVIVKRYQQIFNLITDQREL